MSGSNLDPLSIMRRVFASSFSRNSPHEPASVDVNSSYTVSMKRSRSAGVRLRSQASSVSSKNRAERLSASWHTKSPSSTSHENGSCWNTETAVDLTTR